jgi:hypothetical protein
VPKHPSHILELAKRGAEVRLRELVNEAKNPIGLFPHLRDSFDKNELPVKFIMDGGRFRRSDEDEWTAETADVRCRSESRQLADEEDVGSEPEGEESVKWARDADGCKGNGQRFKLHVN